MAGLAYVPIEQVKASKVNAPKQIDKPDYADKGVSYTGYSKTLQTGNNYTLNFQQPADINFVFTAAGGETTASLVRTNKNSYDFYCQDLILSGNFGLALSTDYLEIADNLISRFVIFIPNLNSWCLVFHFEVPIKFTKGQDIKINFGTNRSAGDKLYANFYGWEE